MEKSCPQEALLVLQSQFTVDQMVQSQAMKSQLLRKIFLYNPLGYDSAMIPIMNQSNSLSQTIIKPSQSPCVRVLQ